MLIDSHSHTQFAAYNQDREAVVKRAFDAGVWMVNVGTQRDTSKAAVEMADKYEKGVYAAVGLHPIHLEKSYHDPKELGGGAAATAFASRGEEFDYEYYKNLANHPKVVAIGECGLDYYRIKDDELRIKNRQREVFALQIKLAQELKKTLMIHCRSSKGTDDAYEDLLLMIRDSHLRSRVSAVAKAMADRSGGQARSMIQEKVIHFYAGSLAVAKKLVEAGFFFTFGGVVTFTRDYDDSIKYIPLDRILLETDAPYVAPEPYRGKRNEPAYIVETAKKIAVIKNISFPELAQRITENARQVFKLHL